MSRKNVPIAIVSFIWMAFKYLLWVQEMSKETADSYYEAYRK